MEECFNKKLDLYWDQADTALMAYFLLENRCTRPTIKVSLELGFEIDLPIQIFEYHSRAGFNQINLNVLISIFSHTLPEVSDFGFL